MIHYRDVVVREACAITCDVCNVRYEDIGEREEFASINLEFGYKSIFEDGNYASCDICQRCIKKLIGPYLDIKVWN